MLNALEAIGYRELAVYPPEGRLLCRLPIDSPRVQELTEFYNRPNVAVDLVLWHERDTDVANQAIR